MRKIAFFIFFFIHVLCFATGKYNFVRTSHVDVLFTDGLDLTVFPLLQKADEVYEKLVKEFGFNLKDRPKVYLIGGTDVANGYANPLTNTIVIYVNNVNPLIMTPNYDDWVLFCFTHELSHLFLMNSFAPYVESLSIFGHAVAAAVQSVLTPMYLHEGLATYLETHITGFGRGMDPLFETYIRNARMADTNLKYASSLTTSRWLAGGPSYVLGYSLLSKIRDEYSHEAVMELVRKFSEDPLKTFGVALAESTHESFLDEWLTKLEVPKDGEFLSEKLLWPSKVDINAWRIYYIGKKYNGEEALYYYDIFSKKTVKIADINNCLSFSVSKSGKFAVARYIPLNNSIISKLYLHSDITIETSVENVVDLAWLNDNELVLVRQENMKRFIDLYDVRTKVITRLFGPFENIVPMQITADSERIVFTAKVGNNIDLFMTDRSGMVYRLTEDNNVKLSPKLINEELYLCADYSGRLQAFLINLKDYTLWNLGGEDLISVLAYEGKVFGIQVVPEGYQLSQFTIDRKMFGHISERWFNNFGKVVGVQIDSNIYFDSLKPRFWLPVGYFDNSGWFFGTLIGFSDDLLDQLILLQVGWSESGSTLKLDVSAEKSVSFSFRLNATNQNSAMSAALIFPFYITRGLRDETLSARLGITLETPMNADLLLGCFYSAGQVGGKLHGLSVHETEIWANLLPNLEIGFSRAFLFKDVLASFSIFTNFEAIGYGWRIVLPRVRFDFGSDDGFWNVDGINFVLGNTTLFKNHTFEHSVYLKTVFNVDIFYQIPVPVFLTVGFQNNVPYVKFGIENILSILRL